MTPALTHYYAKAKSKLASCATMHSPLHYITMAVHTLISAKRPCLFI